MESIDGAEVDTVLLRHAERHGHRAESASASIQRRPSRRATTSTTWVSGDPKNGVSPLVDPSTRADGSRFVAPVGSSLGGDTTDGLTYTYGNLNREHARMQRWRVGFSASSERT
jgi:hypothetical protein